MIGALLVARPGEAHVSIVSGPAFADSTQMLRFGVGHGCEGSDTWRVRVELPAEIVSVRALPGDLGPFVLETDDAGLVTAVTWEKSEDGLLESDVGYYELGLRLRVPNAPFTELLFPVYQTCRISDGREVEVAWVSTEPDAGDGEVGPAPRLPIVPKRFPGWNRFTLPRDVADLATFFGDALIVWRDEAAYSSNPTTVELIGETSGVTRLTDLSAGDEIWVKY